MEKVTINDVAKKAKVSVSTVSRVMTDSSLISEKTRKKVQKVIRQLNYIPNSAAQHLTNNSSKILGIVLNSKDIEPLNNSFFSKILENISEYLLKNQYYTLYIHCSECEDEMEYIKALIGSKRVDGLIFLRAYNDDSIFEQLNNENVPFAIVGRPNNEEKYLWVDNNNFEACYNITKKVISNNYKNLCFVGGSLDINVTKLRYEGYKKALEEANLENIATVETNFELETAIKDIEKLLSTKKDIEAIITTDDILAIAVEKVIEKLKYKNIKVTGFNNTVLRRFANYNFLTVDINIKKLAISVCDLLLTSIKKDTSSLEKNYNIIDVDIIEGR